MKCIGPPKHGILKNEMIALKLDSILLFILVIPFIMSFRIGPGETPYVFFGAIFLLLLSYVVLDLVKIKEKSKFFLKQIVLWSVIVSVIGSAFISAIIVRHQTHPIYMIHDIILQQESAIRFLLDGKNPYATTYFGTPLEQWNYSPSEVNPALYHFVMQPMYLLFALPFYFVSNHTIGYFDGRIPLLTLFLFVLVVGHILIKDKQKRLEFLTLMAFNPAMLPYTLEGRSDMFLFGFLFFSLFLLYKTKYFMGVIVMALAFAVKQSVWPLLPFFVAFLYFKTEDLKKTAFYTLIFLVTFFVIISPFLFWDTKAFLDSTVFYLSGNTPNSYPVSGYGIGKVLQSFGAIKDIHQYYPFHVWQLIIGLPVLVMLLVYLKKSPSVKRLVFVYTVFLFVFWYLSRYFNNSHLGFLSVLFITIYFFPEDNKTEIEK